MKRLLNAAEGNSKQWRRQRDLFGDFSGLKNFFSGGKMMLSTVGSRWRLWQLLAVARRCGSAREAVVEEAMLAAMKRTANTAAK